MVGQVLANHEIAIPVIGSVKIDMMYLRALWKRLAHHFLNDDSMFRHVPSVYRNQRITKRIQSPSRAFSDHQTASH